MALKLNIAALPCLEACYSEMLIVPRSLFTVSFSQESHVLSVMKLPGSAALR